MQKNLIQNILIFRNVQLYQALKISLKECVCKTLY